MTRQQLSLVVTSGLEIPHLQERLTPFRTSHGISFWISGYFVNWMYESEFIIKLLEAPLQRKFVNS